MRAGAVIRWNTVSVFLFPAYLLLAAWVTKLSNGAGSSVMLYMMKRGASKQPLSDTCELGGSTERISGSGTPPIDNAAAFRVCAVSPNGEPTAKYIIFKINLKQIEITNLKKASYEIIVGVNSFDHQVYKDIFLKQTLYQNKNGNTRFSTYMCLEIYDQFNSMLDITRISEVIEYYSLSSPQSYDYIIHKFMISFYNFCKLSFYNMHIIRNVISITWYKTDLKYELSSSISGILFTETLKMYMYIVYGKIQT